MDKFMIIEGGNTTILYADKMSHKDNGVVLGNEYLDEQGRVINKYIAVVSSTATVINLTLAEEISTNDKTYTDERND